MWRWMTVVRGEYDAALPVELGGGGDRVRVRLVDGARWEVRLRAADGAERWRAVVPAAGWDEARRRVEGVVAHRQGARASLGPTIPPRAA